MNVEGVYRGEVRQPRVSIDGIWSEAIDKKAETENPDIKVNVSNLVDTRPLRKKRQ